MYGPYEHRPWAAVQPRPAALARPVPAQAPASAARPTAGQAAVPAEWTAAWAEALDVLELDVAVAERLLTRDPVEAGEIDSGALGALAAWTPPELPCPIPAELVMRAQGILDRQLRASEGLTRAMLGNRQQHRLAQRMGSGARDRSTPAFVDAAM